MAAMEGTNSKRIRFRNGAIPTLMLCGAGDHIVSSRTIYGGTYAFLKTSRQDLISTTFVDITKLDAVEAAITPDTKVLYCETVSNPLLEVADIAGLSKSPKNII
jgi:methionine-gamma-lyase